MDSSLKTIICELSVNFLSSNSYLLFPGKFKVGIIDAESLGLIVFYRTVKGSKNVDHCISEHFKNRWHRHFDKLTEKIEKDRFHLYVS